MFKARSYYLRPTTWFSRSSFHYYYHFAALLTHSEQFYRTI